MIKKALAFSLASMALVAGTAFAQTTTTPSSTDSGKKPAVTAEQIACVSSAVNAREDALVAAAAAHGTAVNAAYTARAAALKDAYTKSTPSEIRTAVKAAWNAFTKSMRTATKDFRKSRDAAWSKFKKDSRACKASNVIHDSGNAGLEASGS